MPNRSANALPRAESREPTASNSTPASRAPAISFALMFAVLRMPQRMSVSETRGPSAYRTGPHSGSAGAGPPLGGQRVDRHGEQQHAGGDDELRARRQAEQAEAIVDRADHERAEDRALHVA